MSAFGPRNHYTLQGYQIEYFYAPKAEQVLKDVRRWVKDRQISTSTPCGCSAWSSSRTGGASKPKCSGSATKVRSTGGLPDGP